MNGTPVVLNNPDHKGTEFFAALEGMRGIAALGVVFYHVFWRWHLGHLGIIRHGLFFVDLFFVISGFVISHIYATRLRGPRDLWEFAVLRTARLYPLHLFTLLLVTGFMLLTHWLGANWHSLAVLAHDPRLTGNTPRQFLLNLFLLHAMSLHHGFNFNRPSWSISTEYFTYFIFALVAIVSARRKPVLLGISMALAGGAGLYLWRRHGLAVNLSLLRCLTGFFTGVLVQLLWQKIHVAVRPRLQAGWIAHAVETACVLFIGLVMWYCNKGRWQFMVIPAFASGVLALSLSRGGVTRLLESRYIQYLGKWSYSIYMTHFIILITFTDALHLATHMNNPRALKMNLWMLDGLTLLFIVAVLLVSSQTYRFIEVPPRAWAKNWAARWKARMPAGTIGDR